MRSKGLYVVLVGPDGAGKSSLAPRLVTVARQSGKAARHMHWRPGLLPQAARLVGRPSAGDSSSPHALEPHGTLLSLSRLLYYWIDFLLGTWLRVLPVRARGGLVVMERGWWDMAVDPRRYHLRGYPVLIRVLGWLLPAPDFVLVLQAPPDLLTHRKRELLVSETAVQNAKWERIQLPRGTVKLFLNASRTLDELVDEATARMAKVFGNPEAGSQAGE